MLSNFREIRDVQGSSGRLAGTWLGCSPRSWGGLRGHTDLSQHPVANSPGKKWEVGPEGLLGAQLGVLCRAPVPSRAGRGLSRLSLNQSEGRRREGHRKGWRVPGSETMSPEPPTDGVSKGLFPQLPRQLRGCCVLCRAVPCQGLCLPAPAPQEQGCGGRGAGESCGHSRWEGAGQQVQRWDAPVNPVLIPRQLPPWWAGRDWQRRGSTLIPIFSPK